MMAAIDTLVSDKTGTLTEGRFRVSSVTAAGGYTEEEVLKYAAAAEAGSSHPIAAAIADACSNKFPISEIKDEENYAGKGIRAEVNGRSVLVGNRGLLADKGIELPDADAGGTCCYVAIDGIFAGVIVVSDIPKAEAKQAVSDILSSGVRKIVMLTGDSDSAAKSIAEELGISEYRSELLPQDKVFIVEELIKEAGNGEDPKRKLGFIGDGINDAPVLSRADVGIAMGSLGSDAAIEAADVVIMDDNLMRIPAVIRIAMKTIGISKANIAFALFVKFACLVLGAAGIANMWAAVFADVGVAVICILNSMRMITSKGM